MALDEELICRSENRDLFDAWQSGSLTFKEAAYIAKRDVALERLLRLGLPVCAVPLAGRVYDAFFEHVIL